MHKLCLHGMASAGKPWPSLLMLSLLVKYFSYFFGSSQDIGISAVLSFLFFCVAIPTAVYAGRFADYESETPGVGDLDDISKLNEDLGSVSVSVLY